MNQKINDTPKLILEKLKNYKSEEEDLWFQKAADLFLILCGFSGEIFDVLSFKWKH